VITHPTRGLGLERKSAWAASPSAWSIGWGAVVVMAPGMVTQVLFAPAFGHDVASRYALGATQPGVGHCVVSTFVSGLRTLGSGG